jgi:hypothetical protein
MGCLPVSDAQERVPPPGERNGRGALLRDQANGKNPCGHRIAKSALLESPLKSHEGKEQGEQQDTLPSVRGVARPWMGCSCMAKKKRQGPRRGEYCGRPSRQEQPHTGNKRINSFAEGPCAGTYRLPPAVLPPPPFPSTPNSHSRRPLPPGGTPLPEGGGEIDDGYCLEGKTGNTRRAGHPVGGRGQSVNMPWRPERRMARTMRGRTKVQ